MYFDTCVCLHYNRATFYRTIIKNELYPIRKCYSCYRRSIKKLLKHFLKLIKLKSELILSDSVKMQFVQPKVLLMQQVLTFILLKKLLFHLQMLELYKQIFVLKFQRVILVRSAQSLALQCNLQMYVVE